MRLNLYFEQEGFRLATFSDLRFKANWLETEQRLSPTNFHTIGEGTTEKENHCRTQNCLAGFPHGIEFGQNVH